MAMEITLPPPLTSKQLKKLDELRDDDKNAEPSIPREKTKVQEFFEMLEKSRPKKEERK